MKKIYNITHTELTNNTIHLGALKKYRHKTGLIGINATTKSTYELINTNYTIKNLTKALKIITSLIAKKNTILIISNNQEKTISPHYFIKKVWENGLISNFKQITKQKKIHLNIPSLIILLSVTEQRNDINTELKRTKIPHFALTDSDMDSSQAMYNIQSNTNTVTIPYYHNLVKQAIKIGTFKEILSLTKRKIKFPRLDSNQRPRT